MYNLLAPPAVTVEELAFKIIVLLFKLASAFCPIDMQLLPDEAADFPIAMLLLPFATAESPIATEDDPPPRVLFPMLIDCVPTGPNPPVNPDPLPIAMESVFCDVPAFNPMEMPPVDVDELPAPVPIMIGSVYTTPVATICQSL